MNFSASNDYCGDGRFVHYSVIIQHIDKLELRPEDTVLDVGCGTGEETKSMAEKVKSVTDYARVYFDGKGDTSKLSVAANSDCQSLLKAGYSVSGIYTIFPAGFADGLRVYCDMETDGGGWLVIQRRQDGSVDFYRGWVDYRVGFGDLAGEFWLGNDNLRTLSDSSGSWDLRIDSEDWDGNTTWAEYGNFRIISGQDYRLSFDSYNANSTARDSLANHNHQPFSTKDKDNDSHNNLNCAEDEKGAWWYMWCSDSNLNGIYFYAPSHIHFQGIIWSSWKGYSYSLKKCGMKIQRSMDYLQAA
ncbi:ryncolin-2-like [Patiria miniata]|uniref:Fibrinogen C-terminal domain-containing protein n=1 Tax=Patiria miniata TaxID=46514 RepID=A0A913Z9V7_PATMI|nr:ryncolin-2-like [Patiria miniata]